MKALDIYITGLHDPCAPFNQEDWVEVFEPVLEHADWITEKMLDDDKAYNQLGEIITDIFQTFLNSNLHYTSKEKRNIMIEFGWDIANQAKIKWELKQLS